MPTTNRFDPDPPSPREFERDIAPEERSALFSVSLNLRKSIYIPLSAFPAFLLYLTFQSKDSTSTLTTNNPSNDHYITNNIKMQFTNFITAMAVVAVAVAREPSKVCKPCPVLGDKQCDSSHRLVQECKTTTKGLCWATATVCKANLHETCVEEGGSHCAVKTGI